MKTLILTEKPSVARDFASALNVRGQKNGYMENDQYVITWAIGHLVELFEPEDYDLKWKRWRMDMLPIIPPGFSYKAIDQTQKQLNVIKRLVTGGKLEKLIIATDAGREGEVIARSILVYLQCQENHDLYRFWTSQALTPKIVKDGIAQCVPASEYDRLWRAGRARQIADWLVGMNISRAASLKMNDLYSVGRVQTAVLALLVDRRRERENFKPEPYWVLRVMFRNEKGTWWGIWFKGKQNRFECRKDGIDVQSLIQGRTGAVDSVNKQIKIMPPPLLYALSDLQQDANRKFGFSAQKTLGIAQKLYESKKCLSYPRTDARVLGTANLKMVSDLIDRLTEAYPTVFSGTQRDLIDLTNKRVFNDARLTDHHALIPLSPLPRNATTDELRVYDLVLKRFAAAFYPDCKYEQTQIVTIVEKHHFKTNGKRIIEPGWQAVYAKDDTGADEDTNKEELLPDLAKGDPAPVEKTDLSEKKTQPPPEYTEALLLKDMTNPGRYVTEADLKKIYRGDVGLGTQATRAQIIETLLKRKYIQRVKKYLKATDKGCKLIDTLRGFDEARKLASPEETARWELELEYIARGRQSDEQFLENIQEFIRKTLKEFIMTDQQEKQPVSESFGTCPGCGGEIIESQKAFGCTNWRESDGGCRFAIWKQIAGRTIEAETAKELLQKRKIGPLSGFTSKKGNPFSASLVLAKQDGIWKVVFDFSENSTKTFGKCPQCGGDIIEGNRGFGCANWRKQDGACRFVIWKTIAGREIPVSTVFQILDKGMSDPLEGFISKKGEPFTARLKIDSEDGKTQKVVFDFTDI